MEEQERSRIDRLMVKRFLAKDLRLSDIVNIKRDIGNNAKELGIPLDTLMEYAEVTIKEIFDEQIAMLKKPHVKVIE